MRLKPEDLKVSAGKEDWNYQGIVANYAPAFERTQERMDAILPASYRLLVFHNGALIPLDQSPYGQPRTN